MAKDNGELFSRDFAPWANDVLSALPLDEYTRVLPNLEQVTLDLGRVLYEPGERLNYIYFPTTSVVSMFYIMEDGSTAEMGLVGCDGVLGIALFLGGETTRDGAVVRIAGASLRMNAKVLRQEVARGDALLHSLLRYTQELITQISQTAVCNQLHSVEKRLCRWLLLCHDRVKMDELIMTQESIANMLGGRRESVTVAAGHLQDSGLIHYSRGHIRIVDRKGLEANACECYRTVKNEVDRLLGAGTKPGFRS